MIQVARFQEQTERGFSGLDSGLQLIGLEGTVIHGDKFAAHGQPRVEGRTIPSHFSDFPFLSQDKTARIHQVSALARFLVGFKPFRWSVRVNEAVTAPCKTVEWSMVAHVFKTHPQERSPIIGLDLVQGSDHVVKAISQFAPIAVLHAEESTRKIIERAGALRELANQTVRVEPDEKPFAVIILRSLPASPPLRAAF